MYSYNEVLTFVEEEDVEFIRLTFFDIFGKQKNISIMKSELSRAFSEGISFDASAIAGFCDVSKSDLFLHPDPSTLAILPWRPSHGRVVRMACDIKYPDGSLFEADSRAYLKKAVDYAESKGYTINFGPEMEFYLFKTDEAGMPTNIPFDQAGYLDVAPEDKGENIRREICFTLVEMGINPESSHHEEGPGQNEIDFRYSDALTAADNTALFKWVVKMISASNGLHADFSPKPLLNEAGNGMHINISVESKDGVNYLDAFMAGILEHVPALCAFLNPSEDSYQRLGEMKAPKFITWSKENRSQLIRIPAMKNEQGRIELRSPDPGCNPYLAFALLIYAGIDGILKDAIPPEPCSYNLFVASEDITSTLTTLPITLSSAKELAKDNVFINKHLPQSIISAYCE